VFNSDFYLTYADEVVKLLETLARSIDIECRIFKNDAIHYLVLTIDLAPFVQNNFVVRFTSDAFVLHYRDAEHKRREVTLKSLAELGDHLETWKPILRADYERQAAAYRELMEGDTSNERK
jgi:hypothetical protein